MVEFSIHFADRNQGFGIQAHEVVLNFLANERVHFVEDQELNPMVYAEQFASPDPMMALPPEDLLRRARMIMATELGKDPLLRDHMRKLFREEARVSAEPTEHGISKIHEKDRYYVRIVFLISDPTFTVLFALGFQVPASEASEGYVGGAPVPTHAGCRDKKPDQHLHSPSCRLQSDV